MADHDEKSLEPLHGIPRVRVLDESGREVLRGYYCFHVSRQVCPLNDELRDDDVHHLVLMDTFADWNMPIDMKAVEITPPHTIEIIDRDDITTVDLCEVEDGNIKCWECVKCGGSFEDKYGRYEYCPRCGRKIVYPEDE